MHDFARFCKFWNYVTGKPNKPYLTAIEEDYSRMIVGYRFSFQASTVLTTALTLRHAICSKEDPSFHAYGIPTVFYTDHGSDYFIHTAHALLPV